ncbi:hypothetical protein GQ600_26494 [Phytophthora cactorum]|nr:hypothetical protein GQ600_26494 [Phytophthora cactorum]
MAAGRKQDWRDKYARTLGLRPTDRDEETNEVVVVACGFCVAFGREPLAESAVRGTEEAAEALDQRGQVDSTLPWEEYSELLRQLNNPEERVGAQQQLDSFFDQGEKETQDGEAEVAEVAQRAAAESHMAAAVAQTAGSLANGDYNEAASHVEQPVLLEEITTPEIVETLVDEFYVEDDDCVGTGAKDSDLMKRTEKFLIRVMNKEELASVQRLLGIGLTFTQIVKTLASSTISAITVRSYARISTAASLQMLSTIMRRTWIYSIALQVLRCPKDKSRGGGERTSVLQLRYAGLKDRDSDSPPSLPLDFVSIERMDAVDLIECYSDRLEQAYDLVFLDNISGDIERLKVMVADNSSLRFELEHTQSKSFRDAWDCVPDLSQLRVFAAGLSTALPRTVVTPKHANIHAPGGSMASAHWSSDDQALLDILLMTEPDGPKDVDMQDVFTPLPAPQTLPQPTSPIVVHAKKQTAKDSPKGKLSAIERRARHREVVKRAYHRNKAALNSLRDTVKELEEQLEKLSMSKQKQTDNAAPKSKPTDEIQRRYALLTNEQEELGNEAARLRLLLNYRQQFATNMSSLHLLDDSDHSDTDSDTATTSSTASLIGAMSPSSSPMCFDTDSPLAMHDVSPLNATQKTKTPFYNEPRPTFVGPTITGKTPLAMAMRKQLGYKPLSFSESSTLVNEMYRCILSFSLNGKAITVAGRDEPQVLVAQAIPGQNPLQLMTSTWQCFSDPECTETKFRGLMTLRILQRVNDDTIVALRESRSEDGAKLYRCVYILFRVRTRKGFLICVRSVSPERLTDPTLSCSSRDGKPVQWTELQGWFVFEPTADGDGAQVEYGGCMDYGDHESVATLAMNTLSIVFKWESMMVGPIFTLPTSSW